MCIRDSAHTDPYTGVDFNLGFEVCHYTLDLTYRVEPNLLHGEAILAIRADEDLASLTLDLGGAMVARRVTAKGAPRVAKFRQSSGKLRLRFAEEIAAGTEFELVIRYGGSPRPIRTTWGEIGWEETESGSLWPASPMARRAGSPATIRLLPRHSMTSSLRPMIPSSWYLMVTLSPAGRAVPPRAGTTAPASPWPPIWRRCR